MRKIDLAPLPPRLRVGTSSFSARDWRGPFYPADLAPADFLSWYAEVFDTVEIDATWYAMPAPRMVEGWARKVPDGFTFSLKVPRAITHEGGLVGCEQEWTRFLRRLEPLGEKRGPLLLQFPYVARGKDPHEYATGEDFRRRLAAFLPQVPPDVRCVVEVRNERWLEPPLLELLSAHGVVLCLAAYFTLPDPPSLLRRIEPVTGGFGYVRFLGDHRRMDRLVRERQREGKRGEWNEILVDRTAETRRWIAAIRELLDREIDVFAYFNNHFAGFAPGSIELFTRLWGSPPA